MIFKVSTTENYSSLQVKFRLPLIKKDFNCSLLLNNRPDAWVCGYSSRTSQGKYVLFLDYDNLNIEDITDEIKYLQEKFKLSNFYVFKLDRENSYHAVCLDCFSLQRAYSILKTTSCDAAFIHAILKLKSREWILRLDYKGNRKPPIFLTTIKSNYDQHVKSTAHTAFLKKIGIPITKKGLYDNCKKLGVVRYNTANRC